MSIRIPGIPGTQNLSPETRRVIEPIKQAIEIMLQTRGNQASDLIDGDRLKRKTVAQEALGDNSVRDRNIPDGEIKAKHISVISLESLSAVLGTITSGRIQNAGNTNYIDFNATGNAIAMKFGGGLEIEADGDARFGGILTANGVVTNANLGTAVVSNTKLASLAVATGNVQANAITANAEVSASGTLTLTVAYQDIVTVTITTTGGEVAIFAVTGSVVFQPAAGLGVNRLRLNRGSTNLASGPVTASKALASGQALYGSAAMTMVDAPVAGTHTYKLQGSTDYEGLTSHAYAARMVVIELKR